MIISHKYRFIFIHIPKTGGVSIFNSLLPYLGPNDISIDSEKRHTEGKKIELFLSQIYGEEKAKEIWKNYFKFAFVRNPYDRVLSNYFYVRNTPEHIAYKNYLDYKSFKDAIKNIAIGRPCYEYIIDDEGKIIVDFIGRFENLQEDFNIICDKLNLPKISLVHDNKTNHKDYGEYYDKESRDIVDKRFKRDLEMFGYNFKKKINPGINNNLDELRKDLLQLRYRFN
jgi:hypothetical protein